MPIYEYRCSQCGAISEFLVGVNHKEEALSCKQCGKFIFRKSVLRRSLPEKREEGSRAYLLWKRRALLHPALLYGSKLQKRLMQGTLFFEFLYYKTNFYDLSPYFFIFRHKVARLIPNSRAA